MQINSSLSFFTKHTSALRALLRAWLLLHRTPSSPLHVPPPSWFSTRRILGSLRGWGRKRRGRRERGERRRIGEEERRRGLGEDANREERRRRRVMKWDDREQQIFSRGRGWRRKRAPCTGFLSMHYSCALFIADVDSVVVPSNPSSFIS